MFSPFLLNDNSQYDEAYGAGDIGDDEEDDMENDDEFGPDAELERPGPGSGSSAGNSAAQRMGRDNVAGKGAGTNWPAPR